MAYSWSISATWFINEGLQCFRRDQSPGFAYVKGQLFIADAIELDADPAGATDVRRPVELVRRAFDQHGLDAGRRRGHHRDVPVVVMIERTRCKDLLANEEGRFAVREPFCRLGQRRTDSPDSFQMFFAHSGLGYFPAFESGVRGCS